MKRIPSRWHWLTAGLLSAVVACQVWLIWAHWIDTDEGAHLMDARLAMEGLTPVADFGSRQPLYVYTYLPALRLFGEHYASGRVMPLFWTLLLGVVLWAMARRLWGRLEAHATLLLFAFAPSIVINSSVVKTEPLAMLLTALGMLGLAVHLRSGRWRPLVLAGASFGIGYYVRESTLAGVLASGLVFLACAREGLGRFLRRCAALGIGYAAIVGAVLLAYASRFSWPQMLSNDSLFPLAEISGSLRHVLGWVAPSGGEQAVEAVRQSDQNWTSTFQHLTEALRLNLHFAAGTLVALGLWFADLRRRRSARAGQDRGAFGLTVAGAWLVSITLLYGYYVLHRGFFQSYVRELIPPAALLSAWALARLIRDAGWEHRAAMLAPLVLLACAAIAVLRLEGKGSAVFVALSAIAGTGWASFHPAFASSPKRRRAYAAAWLALVCAYAAAVAFRPALQIAFPVIALALVIALARRAARRPARGAEARFTALALLAGSTVLTAAYAGRLLSPAYASDWSPRTVAGAVAAITQASKPTDEVLSGGMVWALESGRRPFLNIAHPLAFTAGMLPERVRRVTERLAQSPPRIIVLDHYTEWGYGRHVPAFGPALRRAYRLVWEHRDAWRPVQVYVLVAER